MSRAAGAGRHARNALRYGAVGVALLAAWNFFAPYVGAPSWAPYLDVLPVIVGRTETQGVVINATHIVVMAIAVLVGVKI